MISGTPLSALLMTGQPAAMASSKTVGSASMLPSVRGIVAGMLQPFVGPLGDHRWWPQVVLPVGAVLMGLSFMTLRWVHSPIIFYLWYGLVGAIGMTFISNAVMDAIIFKWFIRKRPQVVMWVNQGPGVAPLLFPVTLTALIGAVGWRDAWLWFGLSTIAILLPLGLHPLFS